MNKQPNHTQIWLVRHGQTDWNLAGRYQGQAPTALNETGIRQAVEMAERLAAQPAPFAAAGFAALYSSDLNRARQTAEILAGRLGLALQIEPGLREISQGAWEGRSYSEVIGHYNRLAASPDTDPAQFRAPGGESVSEVAGRIIRAVDHIAALYKGQRVLIVSHALAIAVLVCTVRGISLREVYAHLPEHAAPVILDWSENQLK